MRYDFCIVGAGITGITLAERLSRIGTVLLIEKRDHIGGNCYDYRDENGNLVQKYGPHIFRTNNEEVWEYLSMFCYWNEYEHMVELCTKGRCVPFPPNRNSFRYLGMKFPDLSGTWTIDSLRSIYPDFAEEVYSVFFKGYSEKQWGEYLPQLIPDVLGRVPIRFSEDNRFSLDKYQARPRYGFTNMFELMLTNIEVRLSTDFNEIRDDIEYNYLIYTGPVEDYLGIKRLPYIHVKFDHFTRERDDNRRVCVVNYASPEIPYTRETDFSFMDDSRREKVACCRETPGSGEPCYPILTDRHISLHQEMVRGIQDNKIFFIGRMAGYRYINMDQAVADALTLTGRIEHEFRHL